MFVNHGNHTGTPKHSNSPRNGPESAKTVNVNDRLVSALGVQQPWKSLWDPKAVSNSARNGPDLAEIEIVDDHT